MLGKCFFLIKREGFVIDSAVETDIMDDDEHDSRVHNEWCSSVVYEDSTLWT